MDDSALQALFLPFLDGALRPPARLLFLRARNGQGLQQFRSLHSAVAIVAEQSFRPFADALPLHGVEVTAQAVGRFDAVLLLPPRQRGEARALLVRALEHATPGGLVLASVANNEGARAIQADLEALAGPVAQLSKHKCRVFWLHVDAARIDSALAQRWKDEEAPRLIADGRFQSRPGLFAWDRIDAASALLAAHLPPDLAGRGADLGAGYGYLSCEVMRRCPQVSEIHLYEAEARALELARENVARCAADLVAAPTPQFFWHDVARGLPQRYDFIVTNPPFHQGRADQPELGRAFIRAAARALAEDGRLLLVANRHLPYEQELQRQFTRSQVLADAQGFKVIQAQGPRP
ncbi:methyltransferase [Tahibacter sp.]|uniref:class I SAM-dependent methyltransferase n=1 Tax=Tahibacter sp. TaxID=2056211 RepID=UPI0028C4065B|nr:methyltransferase [Tahibacter sp.]